MGHGDAFGEDPVEVHAEDLCALAGVGVPGAAGEALAARQVAFQGDAVADAQVLHAGAYLDDGARRFVPQDDGKSQVECLGRR